MHMLQQALDTCDALTRRVDNLEHDKAAQKRLKKVGTLQRIESSDDMEDVFNQGRMIVDLDKDEGIKLVDDQVKDTPTAEVKGRQTDKQAEKQAEIYQLDLDHPSKVLSMQEDDSEVQEAIEVVTIAKLITEVVTAATSQVSTASATILAVKPSIPAAALTVVAAYTRRRKGVIIRDPEEELSTKTLVEIPTDAKSKDKGKGMKKKPQTESEARKNMMVYLKNTAGYKLDFFKGMSYDEIRPIFQASINETPAQKAAKRRKLNEEAKEVEELKKHLEVVHDDDDDVFTEATPLSRKLLELMLSKNLKKNTKCVSAADEELTAVKHKLMLLLLELMLSKNLKKNTKCVSVADEELTAVKHKLMLLVYCC
nr:hypothetical protein [Tanacetum cinerariifolium]